MPSKLKSKTARANGAKSRGPVTPQGRARSSRNSLRHGLRAKSVVLPTESSQDFQFLLASYIQQFDPQGGLEKELVQAMAAIRWRLRRLCTIETGLLNNEMLCHTKPFDQRITTTSDRDGLLAGAFRNLADTGQSLILLIRYEAALNSSHDRACKELLRLQSARHRPQPNEPKPEPGPVPVTPGPVTPGPVIPGNVSPVPSGPGPEATPPTAPGTAAPKASLLDGPNAPRLDHCGGVTNHEKDDSTCACGAGGNGSHGYLRLRAAARLQQGPDQDHEAG